MLNLIFLPLVRRTLSLYRVFQKGYRNTHRNLGFGTLVIGILFFIELDFCPAQTIILTSDQQLEELMDPDKKIDMSLGYESSFRSLREVCEQGKRQGSGQLTVSFDEFFRQYRPQTGTERKLTPDMDEYIDKIKFISDFAADYGMGLNLSLLSPLELGPAFKNQTGEAGRWLGYKVGYRNASDGTFDLSIWQQLFWTNNKGKFRLKLKGVKAYAFREKSLGSSGFVAVNPEDIHEIEGVRYNGGDTIDIGGGGFGIRKSPEEMMFPAVRLHVYYDGSKQWEGYDRVMVLLEYETPEMDYFSDSAPEFLAGLVKKYKDKSINLSAFYSDEMHIQQDWFYFSHHEGGQFNTRFLTKSFSEKYLKKYGQPLEDKHLLYFVYGAPYYKATASAVNNVQYVLGEEPEDIHRTFLMRDRYYKMLNHHVVDLFKTAKEYAEELYGHEMPTGAHASWAQSPTIDLWYTGKLNGNAYKYEYTSNFTWGNTVQQASAACYDYFKWGEYLQPTGNDFAEGGWADRNYYGAAMGASIGVINKYPNAYAAAWGFPQEALHWKNTLNDAYGANSSPAMKWMTDNVHRDVEVLILYPMNLVAVEERFGSWMTQYGYANYITSEKLLEMGKVLPTGEIQIAEKKYGTLVTLFEPLPKAGLLDKMEEFLSAGGKVIWGGPPPLIDSEGKNSTEKWKELFGVDYQYDAHMGEIASGKKVEFCNSFSGVPDQTILTGFLVDRIYPVQILNNQVEVVAKVEDQIVGSRLITGKGDAYFCGFRPRDDQARSLGYEVRTLYEILNAANAYPSSGRFAVNDNPVAVSRTTDMFASKFPNGTIALVKHYRTHRENWPGGFSRNEEADARALAVNPLPSDRLDFENLKIEGHDVTYAGKMNMAFRMNDSGQLVAFNGRECRRVTIDGKGYEFSEEPMDIFFTPLEGRTDRYRVRISGKGKVRIPIAGGYKNSMVKNENEPIKSQIENGDLILNADERLSGQWLEVIFH